MKQIQKFAIYFLLAPITAAFKNKTDIRLPEDLTKNSNNTPIGVLKKLFFICNICIAIHIRCH